MITKEEQIKTLLDNGWTRSPTKVKAYPDGLWINPEYRDEEMPFKMAWDAFRVNRFHERQRALREQQKK